MKTKRCKKCNEIKPMTDFYKKKGGKDGISAVCKTCEKIRFAEIYDIKRNRNKEQEISLNRHSRFRDEHKTAPRPPEHFDNKRDLFKVYAHNVYLFDDHDKNRAIRRAESLGYFKSSINFV